MQPDRRELLCCGADVLRTRTTLVCVWKLAALCSVHAPPRQTKRALGRK